MQKKVKIFPNSIKCKPIDLNVIDFINYKKNIETKRRMNFPINKVVSRENGKLSAKELELLEEFFKLSENQVEDLYKKFRISSDGEKSLSRRKFSDIMHQCFPRTHKVGYY